MGATGAAEKRTSSCTFCWFVQALYPTLSGMTERDTRTFGAHLERAHGLVPEISR